MYRQAFKAAFPVTIPVMLGYLAIGAAFGLMLEAIGYNYIWSFFMSTTIYAGSGQYMGVELLQTGANLQTVALLTLILNFRHIVYGLSLLDTFRGMGLKKIYMIFSLTDETYALLSSTVVPKGVQPHAYLFAIALLNQIYWVAGSVIGSVAGALLKFDTTGVDFAMTALFLVIAVGQWESYPSHRPALLGFGITIISLVVLGAQNMLIPALIVIIVCLFFMRRSIEAKIQNKTIKEEIV